MAETSTPRNNDDDHAYAKKLVLEDQESSETADTGLGNDPNLQFFIQRSEFDEGVKKWKEVGVILL